MAERLRNLNGSLRNFMAFSLSEVNLLTLLISWNPANQIARQNDTHTTKDSGIWRVELKKPKRLSVTKNNGV